LKRVEQTEAEQSAERPPPTERERVLRATRALAAAWGRAKRHVARHPQRAAFLAALAVYLGYESALRALEMPMVLYWGKMQLIDRAYLLAHPLDSLLYLHAQPPLLNALAIVVLQLSKLTGISEAAIASGIFACLGFACFGALLAVARLATGSWIASAACGALLLANPAFAFYRHRLLYEIPAMLAVLLVAWSWLGFVADGKRTRWVCLMFALALLCLTKSLFHPLLALLVALLALVARRAVGGMTWGALARRYASGLALGALLVLLWPAKNQLVFGHFVYSSWLGFNLTVRTPIEPYEPFVEFTDRGIIAPSIRAQVESFEGLSPGDDLSIVLAVKKPSFPKIPNWNHLVVLYTNTELTRRGLQWRLEHPIEWFQLTIGRYFMTMRPSFVFPYSANTLFSGGWKYDVLAARYRDFVHPDLRAWFERAFPDWSAHRHAVIRNQPIPYTPYAFAYPLFLIACAVVALRKRREPIGWFLLLCALMSAWTVFVPALTDGVEGNRMRLAAMPLVCVAAIALIQLLLARLARAIAVRRALRRA